MEQELGKVALTQWAFLSDSDYAGFVNLVPSTCDRNVARQFCRIKKLNKSTADQCRILKNTNLLSELREKSLCLLEDVIWVSVSCPPAERKGDSISNPSDPLEEWSYVLWSKPPKYWITM